MVNTQKLHFVGGSSRCRAEQASLCFNQGYHGEVYADVPELVSHRPSEGIVLAFDDPERGGVRRVLQILSGEGIWLPVIGTCLAPHPRRVVDAVRAGALDYLGLPLRPERLSEAIERINDEEAAFFDARRRMIVARNRIAGLTKREREVLDWLADGCTNKKIADSLSISPRTVEIHRANMMTKLGADHVSQAIKIRLEANLDEAPLRASR